ncbi:MAG TPA: hypothetical protein VMW87_16995 [Spirochaetia bacterium]|nr:hypothetical protein [Spirochaetia bacterium]
MRLRGRDALLALVLSLVIPVFCQAQAAGNLPVPVPAGTTVDVLTYGPDDTSLTLKPAEQVAFLFVYAIWDLESDCASTSSGVGRICSLAELVRGVKLPDGETIGLTTDPARDRNYRYDVTIIGDQCIIRALPNDRTRAGFAAIGAPGGFSHSFFINPQGPDLIRAVKITGMGYSGKGFKR